MNYKHSTPIQIRFNDIDIAGHVNNAVHLYYFDYARMQYFNKVFGETIEWRTEGLVIVNINIDYIKPIYLEEKISVDTKIIKIGNKSIKMIQEIKLIDKPDEIKSKNIAILVGYHYKDNYSFDIPQNWRNSINEFEGEL